MWFVVEYQGEVKVVNGAARATVTDVFAKAFGGDPWGDTRASQMRCLWSGRQVPTDARIKKLREARHGER